MKKLFLGNSNLPVSELCLGAMNFGWKESKENSIERLDEFVRAGGNFIDTANVYSKREAPEKDFYGKDFGEYIDGKIGVVAPHILTLRCPAKRQIDIIIKDIQDSNKNGFEYVLVQNISAPS